MKSYEMLYVIDNSVAEEAKDALVAKFEGIVTSMGGELVSTDKWGSKKLPYAIQYKNEGFFVLMKFNSEPTVVNELDRIAGLSDEILRRMIVKA